MEHLEVENELLRIGVLTAQLGLCVTDASGRVVQLAGDFSARLGLADRDLLGAYLRLCLPATLILPRVAFLLDIESDDAAVEGQLRQAEVIETFLLFQARTVSMYGERFRVISVFDVGRMGVSRGRISDLQGMLEALGAGIVVVDAQIPDQPITFVNRRFELLTGYSAGECIGRNCRFLQGPDVDAQVLATLNRAIALRQPTQVVIRNYRKNGEAFENELYVSPVSDATNQVRWLIGIARERRERAMNVTGPT